MSGYEANTVETALAKITAASTRTESGCLECGLTPSSKYPMVKVNGKYHRALRLVYATSNRVTIPNGMYICHTCDNTRCVEPLHLYMGTPKQNSADRELRGRSKPQSGADHWTARNPDKVTRGEQHGRGKLKEADIMQMLDKLQQGAKQQDIADEFGVARGYVSLVARGKRWAHLAHSFKTT